MKNRFFVILVLALISLPISAWAVDNYAATVPQEEYTQTETMTTSQGVNGEADSVAQEIQTQQEVQDLPTTPYKQPVSKKKILKKFLAAMMGVVASSLTIYFGLTLYNKIRERLIGEVHTPNGETPLNTPEKMEDAVKTFLDKTKWI